MDFENLKVVLEAIDEEVGEGKWEQVFVDDEKREAYAVR